MRILVVEDFQPLRESLQQGLREAGFAVDAAATGNEGLWQAQSVPYDVVVLDLMLPGMDGLAVLKRLREKPNAAAVLILTARDTTDDCVAGLNAGADDYLTKPFAFTELLARVRALLRRRYDKPSPVLRVADLELDTVGRMVRRGGREIALSRREYALLEFLVMRQGQVITRQDVWEHVYDLHSNAESNVVDVYVALLRKKIEAPGLPRLIHTRRGHGYMVWEMK